MHIFPFMVVTPLRRLFASIRQSALLSNMNKKKPALIERRLGFQRKLGEGIDNRQNHTSLLQGLYFENNKFYLINL